MERKKIKQRIHAKQRLEERYDLKLNRHDIKVLVSKIQCGNARFIRKQSNRVTHWMVNYLGKEIHLVYDKKRQNIITALTKGNNMPAKLQKELDTIILEAGTHIKLGGVPFFIKEDTEVLGRLENLEMVATFKDDYAIDGNRVYDPKVPKGRNEVTE